MAWGPRGHRGFSSTARSEEERKLVHLTVEREEMAAIKIVCNGDPSTGPPPARERHTLRHLDLLMLQLGRSATACTSFATWESMGGMQQQGGEHTYRPVLCRFLITLRYYMLVEKLFRAVAA